VAWSGPLGSGVTLGFKEAFWEKKQSGFSRIRPPLLLFGPQEISCHFWESPFPLPPAYLTSCQV
jgi:hypothetical protein